MAGKEETTKNEVVDGPWVPKETSNYIFSYDDLLILNKAMTLTWEFELRVLSERKMGKHKKFTFFAPFPKNNTWYRGEGFSVIEAVEDWIERTTKSKSE